MNKRGFLLGEETVKIIIAVICILFLVLLIAYLYTNYSQDPNLTYAKDSLNYITSEISTESQQAEIYNPSTPWFITSFPQQVKLSISSPAQEVIPNKCSSVGWKSCLCICKLATVTSTSPYSVNQLCDNYGICVQSQYSINGGTSSSILGSFQSQTILINPPLILSINYTTKTIQVNGS